MELDQFRQLELSLGSPGPSEQRQEEGLAIADFLDALQLTGVVGKRKRGEFITNVELQGHGVLPRFSIGELQSLCSAADALRLKPDQILRAADPL